MDDDKVVDSKLEKLEPISEEMGPDYTESLAEQEAMVNTAPVSSNQSYQPNGNNWRNKRLAPNNSYELSDEARQKLNKKKEQESVSKAGGMATRGALDVATGGAYEKVRNAPVVGKVAQAAEQKIGKKVGKRANAITGGKAGKIAKKVDDSGALDKADKAANMANGNKNPSIGNQFAKKNNVPNSNGAMQDSNPIKKGQRPLSSMGVGGAAASGYEDTVSDTNGETNPNVETAENTRLPRTGSLMPKNPLQKSKGDVEEQKKDGSIEGLDQIKDLVKKGFIKLFLMNPIVMVPLALFILLLLMIIFIAVFVGIYSSDDENDSNVDTTAQAGSNCNYDIKTNLGSSFNLSGIKVELINCDGKKSSYKVLETIDFEKYVLGVALAEAGEDSPDEAIKAQIIAARNFALTRSGGSKTGMCPGNYNSCFYGYNSTSGVVRMRACEADQVYWDYTKDIYRQNRGAISLYSPEVNSGTIWKHALSSSRQAEVEKLADSVKGETLVDANGNLVETDYFASVTSNFIARAKEGKSYKEILEAQYGSGNTSSAECNDGSAGTEGYNTSSDGNGILHESLSSFLASKGSSVEEFNNTMKSNINKAGYGTRAGVVAAATSLIGELGNKYNLKFPYFWGGGHEGTMINYASSNWGSTQCHTYANNQSYDYCGLDCSGFVSWAIYNGGYKMSSQLAGTFHNLNGAQKVSLSNSAVLKAGDLLDHDGHVILVIGVDNANGVYKCAEAAGNSKGVLFSTRPFNLSGYWGVNMDGFYNNSANVR